MKKSQYFFSILLCILGANMVFASDSENQNQTLRKCLISLSPDLTETALDTNCIRTLYLPQTLDSFHEDLENAELDRVFSSTVLINNNGVKESVFECRKSNSFVLKKIVPFKLEVTKENTFHYSNNNKAIRYYDSKNKAGVMKKANTENDIVFTNMISPLCAVSCDNKFISHANNSLVDRLSKADVTSEVLDGDFINLKGEYVNSETEKYFEMTISIKHKYAICDIKEYDKEKRILSVTKSKKFIEIEKNGDSFWLPSETVQAQYIYDHEKDNTVVARKLEIIEPDIVSVYEKDFVLNFPANAIRILDTNTGIHIDRAKNDQILTEAIDTISSLDIQPIQDSHRNNSKDYSPGTLPEACKAKDKEARTSSSEAKLLEPIKLHHSKLPKNQFKRILLFLSLAVAIACFLIYVTRRFIFKKKMN